MPAFPDALRSLRRRRLRSALTIAGVAIGAAALILLGALAERFSHLVAGGRDFASGQITVTGAGTGGMLGLACGAILLPALLAALAGAWPAWRAARLAPVDAIRYTRAFAASGRDRARMSGNAEVSSEGMQPARTAGRPASVAICLALAVTFGCAPHRVRPDRERTAFRFPADTFDFANETIWEYDVEPATGRVAWRRREPRPPFALRCGAMARGARQFYAAARFDPAAPAVDEATYARLVRAVLETDPRQGAASRVVIPAYADLRSFSAPHEALLKTALAGPWQSYLQRGNWRMIFPFTARHQAGVARDLLDGLDAGWPPIVHLLRYPELTINHLVLVFSAEETPTEIRFSTYDANDATRPVLLTYDRAARAFSYAATAYFPGGPVKAYEVYDGLVY